MMKLVDTRASTLSKRYTNELYKSFLLDNSNKDCYSVSKVSTTIFSYLHLGHLIKNQTSVSISSVKDKEILSKSTIYEDYI